MSRGATDTRTWHPRSPEPNTNPRVGHRPAGGGTAAPRAALNRVEQRAEPDAPVLGRATEGDSGRGEGDVRPDPLSWLRSLTRIWLGSARGAAVILIFDLPNVEKLLADAKHKA
jgi:hypothetical protein